MSSRRACRMDATHLMTPTLQNIVEQARAALSQRNIFVRQGAEFELHELFPATAWQPHQEPCRQPGSVVMGADSCGNRFLLAPDGSVSFWDHETNGETPLAADVAQFCAALTEPAPVVLEPGQVQHAWIDPKFLAELKRKGTS